MNQHKSQGVIELDIHGMTKYQAKVYIDSQLKQAKSDIYIIRVVHGYHGGTQLREMVRTEYKGNPKVKRVEHGLNPGITELILRELY
ncbi:Smr/MutS family protein [Candidatus Formimonas warabiya]|nr:Smr/MutS family protein [Candidatus Formimonas warabiya]